MAKNDKSYQLSVRFAGSEREDMEAVAWHGFNNSLTDLSRTAVLGFMESYAEENGGMDELRGAYRQARIAELRAEIEDLSSKA